MKLDIIVLSPLVILLTALNAQTLGFWPSLVIMAKVLVVTAALVLWVDFCVERFG